LFPTMICHLLYLEPAAEPREQYMNAHPFLTAVPSTVHVAMWQFLIHGISQVAMLDTWTFPGCSGKPQQQPMPHVLQRSIVQQMETRFNCSSSFAHLDTSFRLSRFALPSFQLLLPTCPAVLDLVQAFQSPASSSMPCCNLSRI
jgi:hypothetical protein